MISKKVTKLHEDSEFITASIIYFRCSPDPLDQLPSVFLPPVSSYVQKVVMSKDVSPHQAHNFEERKSLGSTKLKRSVNSKKNAVMYQCRFHIMVRIFLIENHNLIIHSLLQ